MDKKYVFDRKKKVGILNSKIVVHIGGTLDYRDYYAECCKHIGDSAPVEYLKKYGLPIEFLLEYQVGYDEARKLIIVPHTQDFFTNVYIGDPNKSFLTFQQKTKYEFFNDLALNYEVFAVTENIFDALMLEYSGMQTVALGSKDNKELFVDIVVNKHTED